MVTSLKTDFAQIFSRCPKNLSCPKIWGGCSPPRPPGPYAYGWERGRVGSMTFWKQTSQDKTNLPQWRIQDFFFFCRIPVELENRRSSQGGGGRTPCTLPLDPPLSSPSASFSPYCFLALFLRAALHYPNAWNRLFTRRRQWEELAIFIRLSPKPLDP